MIEIEKPLQRGMTLIEIMIVMAILGILMSVAYPAYQAHMEKTRRSEATSALLELANRMELFYSDNNFRYTATLASLSYGTQTEEGNYNLSVPVISTTAYTLRAQVVAGSPQTGDANCATLTLTSTGVRASRDSGGAVSSGCWVTGQAN